jgi:hypothetical protein
VTPALSIIPTTIVAYDLPLQCELVRACFGEGIEGWGQLENLLADFVKCNFDVIIKTPTTRGNNIEGKLCDRPV